MSAVNVKRAAALILALLHRQKEGFRAEHCLVARTGRNTVKARFPVLRDCAE